MIVSGNDGSVDTLLRDSDTLGQLMIGIVGQLQGVAEADDSIAWLLEWLSVFEWGLGFIQHAPMRVISIGEVFVMSGELGGTAWFEGFLLLAVASFTQSVKDQLGNTFFL